MRATSRARAVWSELEPDARPSIAAMWDDGGVLPERIFYPVAGAFVEMLVTRGGRDRFLELFRNQTLEAARRIYGEDFGAWTSDFEARPGR